MAQTFIARFFSIVVKLNISAIYNLKKLISNLWHLNVKISQLETVKLPEVFFVFVYFYLKLNNWSEMLHFYSCFVLVVRPL